MAKTNWLKHVTNTYKLLKQSNPEAKLKDAMRMASKTFKKVSSVVRDYIPKKSSTKTRRAYKGKKFRKNKSRKNKYRKMKGGEEEAELEESE
jgi:hypothetical protein